MKALISFYQSSIGKKWIVALTGLVLVAFITGHLIGNLQIFIGPEALNVYAERLQSLGDLLWVIRGFLLAAIVVHIVTTVLLALQNAGARSRKYAVKKSVAATTAARTMILSGSIIACFLAFHLLQFTAQQFNPQWKHWHDEAGRHDVFSMMIAGFQDPGTSAFYLLGVFLLCLHISHGIQSFIQTLGGRTRSLAEPISKASPILAGLIFLGYASIPIAALLHFLTPLPH